MLDKKSIKCYKCKQEIAQRDSELNLYVADDCYISSERNAIYAVTLAMVRCKNCRRIIQIGYRKLCKENDDEQNRLESKTN